MTRNYSSVRFQVSAALALAWTCALLGLLLLAAVSMAAGEAVTRAAGEQRVTAVDGDEAAGA